MVQFFWKILYVDYTIFSAIKLKNNKNKTSIIKDAII